MHELRRLLRSDLLWPLARTTAYAAARDALRQHPNTPAGHLQAALTYEAAWGRPSRWRGVFHSACQHHAHHPEPFPEGLPCTASPTSSPRP